MAEEVQRALDRDRVRCDAKEVDRGAQPLVELARTVDVARTEEPDHLLHLRPDDMRVHADAAEAADLEEREDDVVVARIQVETELDDRSSLLDVGIRLLDGPHGRNLGQLRDRLGLEVEDDPPGDVVDDDRAVGDGSDLLEVPDDPADGRLVVVRGHDEEAVDAELVGARREMHRVRRRVRAGARDDRRPVADLVERRLVQPEPLVVGERRRLAGRSGDDEPVGAVRRRDARRARGSSRCPPIRPP